MNNTSILTLKEVVFTDGAEPRSGELKPGERWNWDRLAGPSLCELIGDVLQGMAQPQRGTVTFLGDAPEKHRERVGRIFCGNAFVSNLSISENLRMAIPFTEEPEADAHLETRLREILDACGVKSICEDRPVKLTDAERCFWQWVRALSRPRDLFIFEHASNLLMEQYRAPLNRLVDQALASGAALINLSY